MKSKIKYLIIVVLILLSTIIYVSYSYFGAKTVNNTKDTKINTGNVKVSIDDSSINAIDIAPIYDEDYEMIAYKKDFSIISNSSLNSCVKLYLNINSISDSLKKESFKYKLVSDDINVDGNFLNANNNEKMLLLDNIFIEKESIKNLNLYIWLSYMEDVDQMEMLGTKIEASLFIEGIDSQNNSCNK